MPKSPIRQLSTPRNIADVPLWVRKTQHYQAFLKGGHGGDAHEAISPAELAALQHELDMEEADEQLFT